MQIKSLAKTSASFDLAYQLKWKRFSGHTKKWNREIWLDINNEIRGTSYKKTQLLTRFERIFKNQDLRSSTSSHVRWQLRNTHNLAILELRRVLIYVAVINLVY